VTALALLGLYVIGVVHWCLFFGMGQLWLTAYDWPKENLFLRVLKTSLHDRCLPYHVQVSAHYARHFPHLNNHLHLDEASLPDGGPPVTCRFLALPETVLSPQILLLPYLKIDRFILVHHLLLYSLGFLGILRVRTRYGLSLVPFAALFVLFEFNGYITAHLAAGHSMWGGYFLLPWFAVFILEWVEGAASLAPAWKLGLVLFAILLQGSFHLVTWCWILVGLIAFCNPRLWKGAAVAVGASALLGSFRFIPAAIAFSNLGKLTFSGGYPTLMDVLDAFTVIRDPFHPREMVSPFWTAQWWEYDVYIGILGLAMLVYFGIYRRFHREPTTPSCDYPALDIPLLILFVMSLGGFYLPIHELPIPLLKGERVTSRFIILPVVLLMVIAAIRMQRMLERMRPSGKRTVVFAAAIATTFSSLMTHSSVWAIPLLEADERTHWHTLESAVRIDQADPVYKAGLVISAGLSLLGLVAWGYGWWRLRRRDGAVVEHA
jgi:hypothetical protein